MGEDLIVAELRRRGLTATSVDRNLRVADETGRALPIRFKAIRGPSWQFSINQFLDVRIEGQR